MQVDLIAYTTVDDEAIARATGGFTRFGAGPSDDSEFLIETSGRACYWSFDRPNPETAKTRDYVKKTGIDKGHGSILEHPTATFMIQGVSRSFTHELIRHRAGTAFSELSQRYVDVADVDVIVPPAARDVGSLKEVGFFDSLKWGVSDEYKDLLMYLDDAGIKGKKAREAARSVMPNATETKIVMTANYRAWRHIIKLRGSEQADAEIREWAIEILDQLYKKAPSVFGDFSVVTLADGREVIVG